jgi:polar amino acid transport system substrate-binding protein
MDMNQNQNQWTTMQRRALLALAAGCVGLCAVALSGCSTSPPVDPVVRQILAPSGALRIGVYAGSPTSMVRDAKTGEKIGLALNLGQSMALKLGVPAEVVEFERLAQVIDALKIGAVDFTFTNATEARARDMNFTPPLIKLELGYLVAKDSPITQGADMDLAGLRVGVSQGSSSQTALAQVYKNATLLPVATLKQAQVLLRRGGMNAFASNKAILNEMLDELPGFRILDGRWGEENLAIAIPKGREAGMAFVRQFAQDAQSSGLVRSTAAQVDLRGMVRAP